MLLPAATPEPAPTLVFLHEGLGSVELWRGFPAALAQRTGLRALVYSRYGNGHSTALRQARRPDYMHLEALETLPALLDTLGIGRVVLVGHSDGGSIAVVFAGEHPERVAALVLEAPHLFVEEHGLDAIRAMRETFRSSDLAARMQRYHADAARTFYGWNDVWLLPEFRHWNVEAWAARIVCPVLAIQGDADQYGTLAQIDALAGAAAGRTDRLILGGCGHAPHAERESFVVETIAGWIPR